MKLIVAFRDIAKASKKKIGNTYNSLCTQTLIVGFTP